MGFIFKSLFWLIVLLLLAVPVLGWLALSDQPAVQRDTPFSHRDIAQAKAIVSANLPRDAAPGSAQVFRVREQDIDLVAGYMIRQLPGATADVHVGEYSLIVKATATLPVLPRKQHLNVRFELPASVGIPQIQGLQIGQLPVPDSAARWLISSAIAYLGQGEQYRFAESTVNEIRVSPGLLEVHYIWHENLIDKARQGYFSEGERVAIKAYHTKIRRMGEQASRGSLADAIGPLFSLAANRSRKTSAVVENRALLLVLGSWSSGRGMSALVGELPPDQRLPAFRLSLDGRLDFGQHFLTSAGLVAGGDESLSYAVGLYKEIADSDGGSGFSFTDLAADRAGTRFGELLLNDRTAEEVQQRLAKGVMESDIMPRARDLPEGMSMAEFASRFGDVDDPRYRTVSDEIDRRLDATPLYRQH